MRRRRTVALLGLAAAGLLVGLALHPGWPAVADAVWSASAALGLAVVSWKSAAELWHRRIGADLIAVMALVGALALGESLAGAILAVMVLSGEFLEATADARAGRELTALVDRTPRTAHRYERGAVVPVPVESVAVGDLLVVRPGEVVPVDGAVVGDAAVLDESALTGEAHPVMRAAGEPVASGVVNAGGPVTLRATAVAADSTYAGVVRLVGEALRSRSNFVRLADRWAVAFIPLTLVVAAVGWAAGDVTRALAVLVVATPCPLLLAVPVALLSGMSRAAQAGVILKGGDALEALARTRVLLLDKTGTVTAGHPVVAEVATRGDGDPDALLSAAASLDQLSPHVFARAIVAAALHRGLTPEVPSDVEEAPGYGVRGRVGGRAVAVGRAEWALPDMADDERAWVAQTRHRSGLRAMADAFVAVDGRIAAAILLQDPLRPDSLRTIRALRRGGIRRVVVVTGDHADAAATVAAATGADSVLWDQSPADKVEAVRAARAGGVTAMVGDGINDAPALAAADIGIAMGARGATASSQAAGAVILVDRLDRLADALRVSRRARTVAMRAATFGMGASLAAMAFAAAGGIAPVAGAVLQEVLDVMAIAYALRARSDGARRPDGGPAEALGARLWSEHARLAAGMARIRTVADRLDSLSPAAALDELRLVHLFLVDELLPHERLEETVYYPLVADVIGGEDPTLPMSRGHVEIDRLARQLGHVIGSPGTAPDGSPALGPDERVEARRLLYALHAVLELHFSQEEAAYLSLGEVPEHEPAG